MNKTKKQLLIAIGVMVVLISIFNVLRRPERQSVTFTIHNVMMSHSGTGESILYPETTVKGLLTRKPFTFKAFHFDKEFIGEMTIGGQHYVFVTHYMGSSTNNCYVGSLTKVGEPSRIDHPITFNKDLNAFIFSDATFVTYAAPAKDMDEFDKLFTTFMK